MAIDIMKVARKIQTVEAVQFTRPPLIWEIAQWMQAHKIDSDLGGCEFIYTFQGEKKTLYVKRGGWIVKDEAGFASYSEIDFQKKFTIDRRSDGNPTPGA